MEDMKKVADGMAELTRAGMGTSLVTAGSPVPRTAAST